MNRSTLYEADLLFFLEVYLIKIITSQNRKTNISCCNKSCQVLTSLRENRWGGKIHGALIFAKLHYKMKPLPSDMVTKRDYFPNSAHFVTSFSPPSDRESLLSFGAASKAGLEYLQRPFNVVSRHVTLEHVMINWYWRGETLPSSCLVKSTCTSSHRKSMTTTPSITPLQQKSSTDCHRG